MGTKIYSKTVSSLADLATDSQTITVNENFELMGVSFSKIADSIYFSLYIDDKSVFDPAQLPINCLKMDAGNYFPFPESIKIKEKTTIRTEIKNNTGAALDLTHALIGKV